MVVVHHSAGLDRERRFALDGLLDQDPAGVLDWLAKLATDWRVLHRHWHVGPFEPVGRWWAARAALTAQGLAGAASRPAVIVSAR